MTGDELEERLVEFAAMAMAICASFPKTFEGKHIGEQLFRASTSVAANYAEVRGAESQRDFVHKLGIVRKELNESQVWLRLAVKAHLTNDSNVDHACAECLELRRIISASRITAERTLREGKAPRN